MFKQKLRKDTRGLTLIELVCAVAILSIISMTVGGAMVVATNSYRSGTTETALQQEAQFTINSIESLIIDATDTVEYTGNVLKIKNTDYTYEIVYDSGAHTLTYSQYSTTDSSVVVTSGELLAENVSSFAVDASDFESARNVCLALGVEKDGKAITMNYNITSRNDPNAGEAPTEAAVIDVLDSVTLEPLQDYLLAVNVLGTSNRAFHFSFDPEPDGTLDATATGAPGGILLHIGATENGGDDGLLRLWIHTNATDESSNPLASRLVEVKIRRVNGINFGTLECTSGEHLKAGAEYKLTGEPVGTNLERVVSAAYDTDYVDPHTIKWGFDASSGENWVDYVEILDPPGVRQPEVRFRLKRDIGPGKYVEIIAYGLHAYGMEGAERTNKTGLQYAPCKDSVKLENNAFDNSDLRRGTECWVGFSVDVDKLIREEWEANHPDDTFDPNRDGYNGGYTGNVYFRYYSFDGTHKSAGYPVWKKFTDQGNSPPSGQLKFNASDFSDMHYMKDYMLELCYSFRYNTRDNRPEYYPTGANPPSPAIDAKYIYNYPIRAFAIGFNKMTDGKGIIQLSSYTVANGTGVGTFANPVKVQSGEVKLYHNQLPGASSQRDAMDSVLQSSELYRWNVSGWTKIGGGSGCFQYDKGATHDDGNLRFYTQNGPFQGPGKYKLVLKTVKGEVYADEPTPNQGGRGIIYFEVVNNR